MVNKTRGCDLCDGLGGELLWRDGVCRVVRVEEGGYPGFCRAIWNAHVSEMTDLNSNDRLRLMQVVFAVEAALRELLRPHKINLASLGNITPHLHWHVIPRFEDDPHFPQPIWGQQQRAIRLFESEESGERLAAALARTLGEAKPVRVSSRLRP